jgi:hypothetical protein
MRVRALHIILVCAAVVGQSLNGEPASSFRCEGLFGRDASHAEIVKTFGADQTEDIGRFDAEMTVLFPDDPKRRLVVGWQDQKRQRGLSTVSIEGSSWKIAGIAIGTPLVEVERLNKGAFRINHFKGDHGGAIIDWMGGRLANPLPGGCHLGVSVNIHDTATGPMDDELSLDRTLLSSGPGLRAMKPTVEKIIVSFSE